MTLHQDTGKSAKAAIMLATVIICNIINTLETKEKLILSIWKLS